MVTSLTSQTFQEKVLKSTKPVIVDFWAAWCGPCKMLSPLFEEMEGEFKGKLEFAKINIDENEDVAQTHQIMSIPCLVIFSHGKEEGRIVGMMPKTELKRLIESHLKNAR